VLGVAEAELSGMKADPFTSIDVGAGVRASIREPYLERLLKHGAVLDWVGVTGEDGRSVPYSPAAGRALLLAMDDRSFAATLRACGFVALASEFEIEMGVRAAARRLGQD